MSDSRLHAVAKLILAAGLLFVSFANASGSEISGPGGPLFAVIPTLGPGGPLFAVIPTLGPGGPLFAVIPTLGIGGPLAILALLFPSLFGGVLVLFRQWGAFFTVISVNSLIYCFYAWFGESLRGTWWGTLTALWLVMTLVTLIGAAWAWSRHIQSLRAEGAPVQAPARTEHLVLWLLSLSCAGLFVYYWLAGLRFDSLWALLLILAVGLWVGTAYKLYRAVVERWSAQPGLTTEGVMLWTMVVSCILFVSGRAVPQGDTSELIAAAGGPPVAARDKENNHQIKLERIDAFYSTEKKVHIGMVLSSPCVAGDKVFVAMAQEDPLGDEKKGMGAVFCIDSQTKKILWEFNNDSKMQPVFSSPCVAGGRLYVGEGFHWNPDCKLYCVNARTGKKEGEFPTKSQVESSPCVVDGKVFFGAGNDGIYAADAIPQKDGTMKKLWHHAPKSSKKIIRFGAGPAVAQGKLFIGSGVDRDHPEDCETALFCLDVAKGSEIWRIPAKLPSWAAPVVSGEHVYFALGNGDIYFDPADSAGSVVCLNIKTGDKVWQFDIPNETGDDGVVRSDKKGVHTRPALDSKSIYFGSRNGFCYCLDRFTGKVRWQKDMGSPIFASPILDQGADTGTSINVFVVATGGRVSCLDAPTGKAHWSYHDLEQEDVFLASSPALISIATPAGVRRQIYFGMYLVHPIGGKTPYLCCLEDVLVTPQEEQIEAKQP